MKPTTQQLAEEMARKFIEYLDELISAEMCKSKEEQVPVSQAKEWVAFELLKTIPLTELLEVARAGDELSGDKVTIQFCDALRNLKEKLPEL